jgi:hypothetical protein
LELRANKIRARAGFATTILVLEKEVPGSVELVKWDPFFAI